MAVPMLLLDYVVLEGANATVGLPIALAWLPYIAIIPALCLDTARTTKIPH